MIGVSVGAFTDVGMVRSLNEDHFYVGTHLWLVADGMGGHAAGEVASEIVVGSLRELDRDHLEQQQIVDAVTAANNEVLAYGRDHPEARGLGSTVTGLARIDIGGAEHWAVFNVGDSRVYREYGGVLSRATVDHSEVEELIMQGVITAEQARWHASRSVVTRSIGTEPPPQVDVWVLPQTPGERFIICSDGLVAELDDAELQQILTSAPDAESAARGLVDAACEAGGSDNISVIVVAVAGDERAEVEEITNPRSHLRAGVE
ncbi:MAG: protein phosphatase 2C domain-containing protein [Propionibacteriales bacterium]|nr:protein phosphatase 2C domain-containing protein [Propionibacteriales bacterium]